MSAQSEIIRIANYWAWPGEYKPQADELISFFTDAETEAAPTLSEANKALAAGGTGVKVQGQTKHWCGIFACAVLNNAGVDARWTLLGGKIVGKGITAALPHSYPLSKSSKELRPGDVAIIKRYQHHFVVVDVDYGANQVYCVEGNTSGQIIRWAVRGIKYYGSQVNESITAFYRLIS